MSPVWALPMSPVAERPNLDAPDLRSRGRWSGGGRLSADHRHHLTPGRAVDRADRYGDDGSLTARQAVEPRQDLGHVPRRDHLRDLDDAR